MFAGAVYLRPSVVGLGCGPWLGFHLLLKVRLWGSWRWALKTPQTKTARLQMSVLAAFLSEAGLAYARRLQDSGYLGLPTARV